MNKKVGVAVFICICLAVCYFIDQTNSGYRNFPKTYGEYKEKQEDTAVSATAATNSPKEEKAKEENEDKVVEQKERKKTAYLTFDDGPSENTKKVLKTLDQYNIKATFFVIAEELTPEREELLRQMIADGHVIGVHTYSHVRKKIYANKESCVEDIKKAYEKVYEITGVKPIYYRFPYGSANCYITGYCDAVIRDLHDMGLTYIDWNVSGEDSVGKPTRSSIMKNVKTFDKYVEPVILLHDGKSNDLTADVLPDIIKKIKAAGYEFGTMAERSKPYQWPHGWEKAK